MPARQYPPGPPAFPFLGHLLDVRRDPLGFLTHCARTYGDIASYRVLRYPVYLFSHPKDIENILVTQPANFHKGRIAQASRSLLGNGLLLSEGAYWRRQRRLIQPALARKHVSSYAPLVIDQTQQMLAAWQDGQTLDIHAAMVRLTMQVIAQTLFGAHLDKEVSSASAALLVFLERIRAQLNSGMAFPESLPTPGNIRFRRAIHSLDETIDRIIRQRSTNPVERDDLLSILLTARDESGNPMTDLQLRDEALTLFVSGHETTATALTWTFYLLSQHPTVENCLVAELNSVLDGRTPRVEDLHQLSYAEKVVKEALRLYPPVWAITRMAVQDCTIGGYLVPAGSSVVMSQWVVHHDPRFFVRPTEFIPERWSDDFENSLPRFAYFPFGGGPRLCVGSSFAMLEAVLVLVCIVQRFHLSLASDQHVEPWVSLVLRPKNGIQMEVENRHGYRAKSFQ
jgi:cytochrome P450